MRLRPSSPFRPRLHPSGLRNLLSFVALTMVVLGPMAAAAEAQTVLWSARKNGGVVDLRAEASAVAVDGSGNVFVAGSIASGTAAREDLYTAAYDSAGNLLWAKTKDGNQGSNDAPVAVAVGGNGNVFVTGWAYRLGYDFLTVAYDAAGNELWTRTKNGTGDSFDLAAAIAVDSAGRAYVTGYSISSGGDPDFLTVAYDTQGNELWAREKDGAGEGDSAADVAVNSGGIVFVTGGSSNGTDSDFLTVVYDSAGTELWAARRDGAAHGDDLSAALAIDGTGRVLVAGESSNGSNADFLTVAYDGSGNELWARTKNGAANGEDLVTDLAVGASGSVFVTGSSSNGTDDDFLSVAYDGSGNELWATVRGRVPGGADVARSVGVLGGGDVVVTGESSDGAHLDYLTVAYGGASGGELWARVESAGPDSDDSARALAIDPSGHVLVTGGARGVRDLDFLTVAYDGAGTELWAAAEPPLPTVDVPAWNGLAVGASGNTYLTGTTHEATHGEFLTVAYDSAGNELWSAVKGGTVDLWENAAGLALDADENVYVTGSTFNGLNAHILTVAYDSSGNELWARTKGSPAGVSEAPEALAVDGAGNVYVAGVSYDGSEYDFLTVAYDSTGNELWAMVRDGPGHADDYAGSVQAGASGNVYVAGATYFDGDYRNFIVAYDAAGSELWAVVKDDSGGVSGLSLDSSENVIVTGNWFNPTTYSQDFVTVAYDSSGLELWSRAKGVTSGSYDVPFDVAADAGGIVYVTGRSESAGEARFLTLAYDSSGNELWARMKEAAPGASEIPYDLAVDPGGGVYVSGRSYSTSGNYDYLLVAYSGSGHELWSYRYDGGGEDSCNGVVPVGTAGAIVYGSSDGERSDYFSVRLADPAPLFADGFESGDTSAWSGAVP